MNENIVEKIDVRLKRLEDLCESFEKDLRNLGKASATFSQLFSSLANVIFHSYGTNEILEKKENDQ